MTEPVQKIIAAMPAYNEEKYIGTLVLQTRKYADEVIVVDDGSRDKTAEIAKLAGATVVRHEKNLGYGATIQDILSEARRRHPDILVLLDADAQHDPAQIPLLIKPLSAGFDLVIGTRKQHSGHIPFYRRIGQKVLLHSTRLVSNSDISDSECGFRAFSSKALDALELREEGMAISAETIIEATRKGLKITQVPVIVTYSGDGSTMNPVTHGIQVLVRIIAMISERRPLFFFGYGGLISFILGLVATVRVFAIFTDVNVIPMGTALVAVFLLLVGIFSMFTGIILYVMTQRRN